MRQERANRFLLVAGVGGVRVSAFLRRVVEVVRLVHPHLSIDCPEAGVRRKLGREAGQGVCVGYHVAHDGGAQVLGIAGGSLRLEDVLQGPEPVVKAVLDGGGGRDHAVESDGAGGVRAGCPGPRPRRRWRRGWS